HSNSDHIDGLPMLSELWEIDTCYTAAIAVEMNKMQASISKASLEQTLLEPGQVIPVSDGLYFEVLGPIRYNPLDDNDNSLVLRMTVNGRTILFAGDMQYDEEKTLMRAGFDLRCDLLKVGNHGNKDATSVSFMEETSPSYAVITTDRTEDENSAHKSVCKGLEEVGAEIFITDEYDLGLLCRIAPDGKITMKNAEADDASADVRFVSISKEKQTAVIKNHDKKTVDLSGWFIISERGGEIFRFPDGAVIEPGEEKTIACIDAKGTSDFLWKDTSVWNKNKDDAGRLVDRYGNVVDVMESE
ncbi:MAG: lamin tail domain-containing protein, partial [Eubacteriales bacterium]